MPIDSASASLLSLVCFAIGSVFGAAGQRKSDADQAISEKPNADWRRAIVDAVARKQKAGIK